MDAWQELGIAKGSSLDDVRRAWRAAALEAHPDRGGDPSVFNRKRAAWNTLRGLASRGPALYVVPPPEVSEPRPWDRARAINRAAELDLYIDTDGDVTGVASDAGVVAWFGDDGVEVEDWAFDWPEVDDIIMWSVFDLVGARQPR